MWFDYTYVAIQVVDMFFSYVDVDEKTEMLKFSRRKTLIKSVSLSLYL